VSATLSRTCPELCRKVGVMEFGLYDARNFCRDPQSGRLAGSLRTETETAQLKLVVGRWEARRKERRRYITEKKKKERKKRKKSVGKVAPPAVTSRNSRPWRSSLQYNYSPSSPQLRHLMAVITVWSVWSVHTVAPS